MHPNHRLQEIELIGSDLDGTLLDHPRIPDETLTRLAEWKDAGGRFAIVTGRPPWDLFEIMEANGIGHLLDAVICEERDIYLNTGTRWTSLGNHAQQLALELSCLPEAETVAEHIAEVAAAGGWGISRSGPEMEARRGYIEIYFPEPEYAEEGRRIAQEHISAEGLFLSVMRNVRHLSLRHPYSKKGCTLRVLADFWGIHPYKVAAVGDSLNDMSMLDGTFGFLGTAVANSDPAILGAVADKGIILPRERSAGVGHLLGIILEAKGLIPDLKAI